MRPVTAAALLYAASAQALPVYAQDYSSNEAVRLPDPDPAPLSVDAESDPILAVGVAHVDQAEFHRFIVDAIKANPSLSEGQADVTAALASKRAADSVQLPRVDLAVSANRAIAREFSNDPDNVIERARGSGRVDATAKLEQVIVDFGASRRRIDAAIERIAEAEAEYDRKSEAIALRAIGAWYDLFAYSHLSELAENFIAQNEKLRVSVDIRIAQGVAAPVERAQVDSRIASARLRSAQYRRELANARARFQELFSLEAPFRIFRAPTPELERLTDDALTARAETSTPVRVAEASARAARADADAARGDAQPNITAGVDAGRFGLYEPGRRDYDIRGVLTFRYRLFGPGRARADEARAKADAAYARALNTRLEAVREARIAWTDVGLLDDMLSANRADYAANRITRDAVVERFRVSRGTLYDALDSEDRLFMAAANYIRVMSERDVATFVALARSGDLLRLLETTPAEKGMRP